MTRSDPMRDRRWIVLAVLCAARAATGFQFQSVASVTDAVMALFETDHARVGLLLGAYLLPGVVVALPAGLVGQHLRDKLLAILGLAMMVVSGWAFAQADGFGVALLARLTGGVGATIVILVATKLTTDCFEGREIVLAMSLLQMSWPFGAMLALPVQAIVRETFGWEAVMVAGSLFAAAVLFAIAMLPASAPQPARREVGSGAGLPQPLWLPIVTAGLIWGMMNLACVLFFSYAPSLLVAQGYSPTAAASLTGLSIWLTILAIPSGGFLVHRLGQPLRAIQLCGLVAALLLLLLVLGPYPVLACLAFGIFIGPLSGAILSLPAAILPEQYRSFGFGLFYTCFYVLMAFGPSVAGRLQDAMGDVSVPVLVASCLLAAMTPLTLMFAALSSRLTSSAASLRPGGKQEATVQGMKSI